MPSLDGKSEAYKNAFSEGFTAGATEHFKALAAEQQAKKNADTASETFNEFRKQEDQALADKFATTETSTTTANGAQKTTGAQKATTDTNKTTGTAAKTTTPEPKALATKTTAADTKAAATTAAPMSRMAQKAAAKAYPSTGDDNNVVASALGVVAVMGALFGFAGTSLKKRA
ncbi:LPXTG cell wall anchor domain-containing protein [Lacticaseibacillus thailandensis]|uniref:Gram-positive cocci surface proteins LPxTG domain-containing protein n=1 Tax=Lacticaseibacillus thailandensis DSM 22698 = JCM 13996 TaxID=1423810 RepID=A0A0R2C788_9LACO|nr:LPXTG cell wall anchor domain-containing protein [Lacticaseibacillus thailandensis]KRM87633.1 hypothetical protein FD19_GL001153 [Lacticaseibacillus thailandensis DSM 22698 = JCM 13996]